MDWWLLILCVRDFMSHTGAQILWNQTQTENRLVWSESSFAKLGVRRRRGRFNHNKHARQTAVANFIVPLTFYDNLAAAAAPAPASVCGRS